MSEQVFQILSGSMRFWFILLIGGMLLALVFISLREYKDKRSVIADVSRYIGYLEILYGPEDMLGARVGLTNENTIGSGSSCEICLHDASVEKFHAELIKQGEEMYLYPKSPSTKLNGARISQPTEVFNEDIITFGGIETLLFIRLEDEDDN